MTVRGSTKLASAGAALLLALALVDPALAERARARRAPASAEVDLRPPPGLRSRSLRYPWDGQLSRGLRVQQSEYVRYVGEYAPAGRFYGTWELVQLMERSARRVAFRLPGARLSIGELSRPGGGRVDGHRSHESGRDVDVGFYVTNTEGKPMYTHAFADIDARGRGVAPNQYLRFDDARNWELVGKLLTDGDARVQHVFVANHLKQRLLDEARRRSAPAALIERAKAALAQPAQGHPHANHFHVRVYCAPADRGICHDGPPYWPWNSAGRRVHALRRGAVGRRRALNALHMRVGLYPTGPRRGL